MSLQLAVGRARPHTSWVRSNSKSTAHGDVPIASDCARGRSGRLHNSLWRAGTTRAVMFMTPTILLAIAFFIIAAVVIFTVRRSGQTAKTFELGAVSTRWLSELRRDEPWTRS
jgi:hypothetical protein